MTSPSPVKSRSSSNAPEAGASPVANHNTDHDIDQKAVPETDKTENKNPDNDTAEKEGDLVEHNEPDMEKILAEAGIDDRAVLAPAMLEFVSNMRRMNDEAVASGSIPPWGDGDLNRDMFAWLSENYDLFRENLDERQPGARDDPEKMARSRAAFKRLLGAMFPEKMG